MRARSFVVILLVAGAGAVGRSQAVTPAGATAHIETMAPGTRYDAGIPTPKAVLGFDFGEEIASPEQLAAYLRALHAAAPERTALVEYARSWEGRPLNALVVGSAERIARLDGLKADLRRLADPRELPAAEAERLVRELPVVVALLHGVHGNEISSGGAAMAEAYHLLAAQGDPGVDAILGNAVVLIDPAQNPDGRARFLVQHLLGRAVVPDADPLAAEHDEPWPGGRSNHYLFDLNRDWFAQTQPESRGRVRLLLDWMPHVVVDLHEMGGESTYYFPPAAPPPNAWTTDTQLTWLRTFGRANAARFDARGFAYFTGEVFDAFYPGYGVSWPTSQGALGMTFEKASARGLVYRRRDGTLLTYLDGIREHFTAAMTTAETAARNREALLRDFLAFRRNAAAMGEQGPVREYVLEAGRDPAQVERLARVLMANGVDVRRATQEFTAAGRSFSAGSFVVPLAQPAARLIRNLLDAHTPMEAGFVARQEERRRKRLPDEIYDVTAWSLPLLWDVECVALPQPSGARTEPLPPASIDVPAPVTTPEAKVGYLLPWGPSTAAFVAEAQQVGVTVRFVPRAFTLGGRRYERGTALIRVADHRHLAPTPEDAARALARTLSTLRARHDPPLASIDSAMVEQGMSLGSNEVLALKAPRVLLVWDAPASSLSAGWARFVLERRYGIPTTVIRTASLPRAELSRFDVIVLPSGSYSPQISGDLLRAVKEWVSRGGTLVTLAEASRWAAQEGVGLLGTRTELRDGRPEGGDSPKATSPAQAPPQPIDYEKAIQPASERPELVPGAILRVVLDADHWLSSGTDGEIQAMVESQRVFTPITLDKGRNVGTYAEQARLVASGIVWPESQALLAHKAYLIHQPTGRGQVIAFAEDPNARAFAEATQLLFVNAVLLGAGR